LSKTVTGENIASENKGFGPKFSEDVIKDATSMEIWHSEFSDPGADKTEFILKNGSSEIGRKSTAGY